MTDAEKAHDLIDDLSWMMNHETYRRYLAEYDRLCQLNEVGRGCDVQSC
jgi:hypothetical protein